MGFCYIKPLIKYIAKSYIFILFGWKKCESPKNWKFLKKLIQSKNHFKTCLEVENTINSVLVLQNDLKNRRQPGNLWFWLGNDDFNGEICQNATFKDGHGTKAILEKIEKFQKVSFFYVQWNTLYVCHMKIKFLEI